MGKAMLRGEPSLRNGTRFTVGRDENGCWVVCDREGLVGGFFRDRASAVHFAMFESDHQPGAVCCVPDGVILSSSVLHPAKAVSRHRPRESRLRLVS
jgi:hypothetical protein